MLDSFRNIGLCITRAAASRRLSIDEITTMVI